MVAPLDWGLGHTTRCIPIIRELISAGCEVFLAAEKGCAILLSKEFPLLRILPLRGYRITYSANERLFLLKMVFQIPKIATAIRREHLWLQTVIKEHGIDTVISDNRFGMHSRQAYTLFITHQLHIKTGNRFTEKVAQWINYRRIRKFNECWVPDAEGEQNLAGDLSHPAEMPGIPVKYIGPLCRFEKKDTECKFELLVMLSGPEPQRTILENILLPRLYRLKINTALVRGLPAAAPESIPVNEYLCIWDHLPGEEMEKLIATSKIVIARSGYTTIMELAAMHKKAILIPTPGQNEQEYLAKYLSEKKYCISAKQSVFDLTAVLQEMKIYETSGFPPYQNNIRSAVRSLL